jgi:hypothetical protein
MREIERVIATTHVDAHNERIAVEGLESMVEKFSTSYVPFIVEHDPRTPPLGRVDSAFIRERPDGEHELVARIQLFEKGENPPLPKGARRLTIPSHRSNGLTIGFDRTFRFDEDQADISEIGRLFRNPAIEEGKKSLDPISVLKITGIFALSSIAAGFFGQIGADGWNALKDRLANLFTRKANREKGQLLILSATIRSDSDEDFEVQIILTNPTHDDIENALPVALETVDEILPVYRNNCPEAGRFVFEVENGELELKFVIRNDCLPLFPSLGLNDIRAKIRNRSGGC